MRAIALCCRAQKKPQSLRRSRRSYGYM